MLYYSYSRLPGLAGLNEVKNIIQTNIDELVKILNVEWLSKKLHIQGA